MSKTIMDVLNLELIHVEQVSGRCSLALVYPDSQIVTEMVKIGMRFLMHELLNNLSKSLFMIRVKHVEEVSSVTKMVEQYEVPLYGMDM